MTLSIPARRLLDDLAQPGAVLRVYLVPARGGCDRWRCEFQIQGDDSTWRLVDVRTVTSLARSGRVRLGNGAGDVRYGTLQP